MDQQCHDYRNLKSSYIYNFSHFKTRKFDYVQESPSFERCSCDIGEILNGIFCCKDEHQFIHQTGRRCGYCYPSKALISKQTLERVDNIKSNNSDSAVNLTTLSDKTNAEESEIFVSNSWTNSD